MYYDPTDHTAPVHPEYAHYAVPFVGAIEDAPHNVFIVPEIYKNILLTKRFKNVQKIIWWLSIDNFYRSYYEKTHPYRNKFIRAINKVSNALFKRPAIDLASVALASNVDWSFLNELHISLHLAQSHYAKTHLESKGIKPVAPLFEYIPDSQHLSYDPRKKEDLVLFNPVKGAAFTKKIMARAPHLRFVPIEKLTHDGVLALMQRSKVYIDFGNHPGQDRMPREAALSGCCVITGKRGAAAFFEDVPIPDQYRFDETMESLPAIVAAIGECVDQFETKATDFDSYRATITGAYPRFIDQLRAIFSA